MSQSEPCHCASQTAPGGAGNLPGLFGDFVLLPVTLLTTGMGVLTQSLRGMQGAANGVAGSASPWPAPQTTASWSPPSAAWEPTAPAPQVTPPTATAPTTEPPTADSTASELNASGPAHNPEKETMMMNTDLRDDMLKLVTYSIVCIERGRERALVCNQCRLFSDNMTDCDFDTWVVADFISQWQLKHPGKPFPCNKKDLRVAFEVKGRWPKQELHYEEKQLRRLHGIEEAIIGLGADITGVEQHPDE